MNAIDLFYFSLYPEHCLQVSAATFLNIQSEGTEAPFIEEELALTVHGNRKFGRQIPFSLEDFDCTAPVPPWLPTDRWEDLLASSILQGTLEGLCAKVAQASDIWKGRYDADEPEVIVVNINFSVKLY